MPYSPLELAEAFIKTGELADALDALNQQLEQQPDDEETRRLRIDVQLRLDTAAHWQRALADVAALTQTTAADYQRASVLHERLSDPDSAIAAMHTARKLAPDDERLTERLLNLLMAQKQHDTALTLVHQQEKSWRWLQYEGDLLALMGDDTTATARYGLVLAQLDEREGQMRADYLQAMKARVLLARAHAYRRLKQLDSAREHYLAAQELLPKDPTIAFNLGLLHALAGNIDTAAEQCHAALNNAPAALRDEMLRSIAHDETFQLLREKLGR